MYFSTLIHFVPYLIVILQPPYDGEGQQYNYYPPHPYGMHPPQFGDAAYPPYGYMGAPGQGQQS